ncbi:MAG: hypothetical protein U0X87_16200 [Anaerolineales bacterium]
MPVQFILPHFDAMPLVFKPMIFALRKQLKKGEHMLGVDENTAIVGRIGSEWKVMGRRLAVHLITRDKDKIFKVGETVPINNSLFL